MALSLQAARIPKLILESSPAARTGLDLGEKVLCDRPGCTMGKQTSSKMI